MGALWVSQPREMRSTPLAATAAIRSGVMPPEASVTLPGEEDIHREFFTAIRDARPLAQAAGAEVRHTVALACAAGESGRTGRVVTVDPGPPGPGG